MAGRPKSILRPGIAGAAAVLAALPFLHCASVPKASVEKDIEAKTSPLPEGFGRLYVYRASGWSLFRSLNDIYVDENFLGTLENGRYAVVQLSPGAHKVVARIRRAKHLSVDASGEFVLGIQAGEIQYLRVKPSGTYNGQPSFLLVPTLEGSAAIQKCVLVSRERYY